MASARFQTIDETGDRTSGGPHLALLRAELARRGVDGFVVPRADEHQNEYVPPCAERLAWLTGYTGSWGTAIARKDEAAIFVDGRYTVQAGEQVDAASFAIEHLVDTPPETWLASHLKPGQKLAYDPALHTPDSVKRLERACAKAGAALVALDGNPIDAVWADRPPPPLAPVVLHPGTLAGEEAAAKIGRIGAKLAGLGDDALVVTDPHALAWTFNLRGGDVSHTPLPLGYALVPRQG